MPIYSYRNEQGETREAFRRVDDRDQPPAPGFVRVPALPAPHDLHARSEDRHSIRAQVARGLKKAEGHPSMRDINPAQAKAVWGLN